MSDSEKPTLLVIDGHSLAFRAFYALPVDSFVISDGLHMNDWGYACFAQLLGDDIIQSVGQIKLGVNVPAEVRTYRPM